MEIVSGLGEKPHVTSQQFRQILEGTIGQKSYIVTSGENLEPELAANNLLKIRSGMMSHHGNVSSVKIGTYDEVELTNGSQGMKRIDLVVNRYTRNAETNIEKNEWVVIMGTPVASNPVAPAYTVGNLQKGDLVDDCPVFELHYDGINVTEVKKMLSVLPNVAELNSNIKNNAGIIAYMKYIALSFHTSDNLQVWIKDVPDDIFSNPGNYTVALAMRQQSGTPYWNVSKMTYEIRTDPLKQFVVNAYGAGFVSGHMLDVSVTIFKILD